MINDSLPDAASLHAPVLREEILDWLRPHRKGVYVDATLGLGGHTEALLDLTAPTGRVIGCEWDEQAMALARKRLARFGDRFLAVSASYANLSAELKRLGIAHVDGLIADLGVSSLQFDQAERGFSFRFDYPLDMRMDKRKTVTAADLVARLSEGQLADIFFHYGEERQARRIAGFLVRARQEEAVTTTGRLAALVAAAVPLRYHPTRMHVATKVFQALRIAVNNELDNLSRLLQMAPEVIAPGCRAGIITFHSLEDRMVKQAFAQHPDWVMLTRKPVEPTLAEVRRNPRARSAKLRVAERR